MHIFIWKNICFHIFFHRYRYFQFDKGIHIEGISGFELLVQINVVKNSREITINRTIFFFKVCLRFFWDVPAFFSSSKTRTIGTWVLKIIVFKWVGFFFQ